VSLAARDFVHLITSHPSPCPPSQALERQSSRRRRTARPRRPTRRKRSGTSVSSAIAPSAGRSTGQDTRGPVSFTSLATPTNILAGQRAARLIHATVAKWAGGVELTSTPVFHPSKTHLLTLPSIQQIPRNAPSSARNAAAPSSDETSCSAMTAPSTPKMAASHCKATRRGGALPTRALPMAPPTSCQS
jgi:hypothetical protein